MANTANRANNLITYRRAVTFCFLTLLLSFASLAPGGPIENRDFSHLSSIEFWGFNVFLITLGLSGIVTVYFIWKGRRVAYWAAVVIGWLYIIVIALDLSRIFPVSPTPTSFPLGITMILDGILAANVILFSHKALNHI